MKKTDILDAIACMCIFIMILVTGETIEPIHFALCIPMVIDVAWHIFLDCNNIQGRP